MAALLSFLGQTAVCVQWLALPAQLLLSPITGSALVAGHAPAVTSVGRSPAGLSEREPPMHQVLARCVTTASPHAIAQVQLAIGQRLLQPGLRYTLSAQLYRRSPAPI